ncbi:hypothetical protein [Faecalibacter rhinopitheci]|uniref:Uncharacterized protein n=1 Tax=Faecalibacter rhinopitheci TaxID=2779678 RepID=A0A8J7FQI0_9FLAO|nr:hypothetical protein [Faecalibacter rhinopitheci]MBF0597839.1 hypothetical protein [Faecalibacter rhinopitheci]
MNFKYKVLFFLIPMMIFSQNKNDIDLKEVLITANKKDTIVVSLDSLAQKGNIAEAIKNLPGFFIDNDKIFYQGQEIKKMTIDKKEMYAGNTKITSEQIPSEWIEQLKISGLDNANESPSIELSLKKEKKNAISATFETLVANGSRYRYYGSVTKVNKTNLFNFFIDKNNIQKNILPNDFIYPELFNSMYFPKKDLVSQIMYSPNDINNISLNDLNTGDYAQWQFGSNVTIKKKNIDYSLFLIGNLPNGNLEESRLLMKDNATNVVRQEKSMLSSFDKKFINLTQKFNYNKDNLNVNFFNQWNYKNNINIEKIQSNELFELSSVNLNNIYQSNLSLKEKAHILYNKFLTEYKINRAISFQAGGELNFNYFSKNDDYNHQLNYEKSLFGKQNRNAKQWEYLYFISNSARINKRMQLNSRYFDSFNFTSNNNENYLNGGRNNILDNYTIASQQRNVESYLWYINKQWDVIVGVDYVNLYYRNENFKPSSDNYIFPKFSINYKDKKSFQYRISSSINKSIPVTEQLLPLEDKVDLENYWVGNNSINPVVFNYNTVFSVSKKTNHSNFTFNVSHTYIPKIWIYNQIFNTDVPVKEYFLYDKNPINNFSASFNFNYLSKEKTFSLFNLLMYRNLNSYMIFDNIESKLKLNSLNNVTHLSYKLNSFIIGMKNNFRFDMQNTNSFSNSNLLIVKKILFKHYSTELEVENRINHSKNTQITNPILHFNSKRNYKYFSTTLGIYNLLDETKNINITTTKDLFINNFNQNRMGRYIYFSVGITI